MRDSQSVLEKAWGCAACSITVSKLHERLHIYKSFVAVLFLILQLTFHHPIGMRDSRSVLEKAWACIHFHMQMVLSGYTIN